MQLQADHKAPPPVRGAALGEVSTEPLVPPVGKENLGDKQHPPTPSIVDQFFCRSPCSDLTSQKF